MKLTIDYDADGPYKVSVTAGDVGWMSAFCNGQEWQLFKCFVDEDCRRTGIGGRMLDALLEHLTDLPCTAVVKPDNDAMFALCASRGFAVVRSADGESAYVTRDPSGSASA